MQGVRMKSGLPAPYNLKPKKGNSMLTTPMKKLIVYTVVLMTVGYTLWLLGPKKVPEPEYELDTKSVAQKEEHREQLREDAKKIAQAEQADQPGGSEDTVDGERELQARLVKTQDVDADLNLI